MRTWRNWYTRRT